MGIRIHKSIGYGLNDVKTGKTRITDKRFDKLWIASGKKDESEIDF